MIVLTERCVHLRLSFSHGCDAVLQRWAGGLESLAEGSQAPPTAVNHHWDLLQCGVDRWAPKVWTRRMCVASVRRLKITTFCPFCHVVRVSVRLPPPHCRLQQSQRWAEGGPPLVVSPAAAGGAAVWDTEAHRGQRGEAGGDRTQVPLHPRSPIPDSQ